MSSGIIGIYGVPNSGKTTFMAVTYGLLSGLYFHKIIPSDPSSNRLLKRKLRVDLTGSDTNLETYLRDKLERILSGATPRRTEPSLLSAMTMKIIYGRKKFLLRIADTSGENYVLASNHISKYIDTIKVREPGLLEHLLLGEQTRSMSLSTLLRTIMDIFDGITEELSRYLLSEFVDELSKAFYRGYLLIVDRQGDTELQDHVFSSLLLYVLLKHIRYGVRIKTPMIIRGARFIVNVPVTIAFSKSETEHINWYDRSDLWLNAVAFLEFKRLFPRTYDILTRFFTYWRELRHIDSLDVTMNKKKITPVFYYSAFGRAAGERPILEDGVLRPWRILLPLAYCLGIRW